MSEAGAAIVTGGAQGLGAAICRALLDHGYKVCVADIQEKGRLFVEEQQRVHGQDTVIFSLCDVTKETDYERTFDETIRAFGKVDLLVNNAGIIDERNPRTVVDVNLMGPIIGCHTAFKYMGKSNGGQGGIVINTASGVVFHVASSYIIPLYAATKYGVLGLTKAYGLPFYLKKEGIIFAAICPYLIDTEIVQDIKSHVDRSQMDFVITNMMSPDYVAKGVLKILEDKINGSALMISSAGGYNYIESKHENKV